MLIHSFHVFCMFSLKKLGCSILAPWFRETSWSLGDVPTLWASSVLCPGHQGHKAWLGGQWVCGEQPGPGGRCVQQEPLSQAV